MANRKRLSIIDKFEMKLMKVLKKKYLRKIRYFDEFSFDHNKIIMETQ